MINYHKNQDSPSAPQSGSSRPDIVRVILDWSASEKRSIGKHLRDMLGSNGPDSAELHAIAMLFGAGGESAGTVYTSNPTTKDSSVKHSVLQNQLENSIGEVLGGGVRRGAQSFLVDLTKLAPGVEQIVFTVSVWRRYDMSRVQAISCRLVDENTQEEIAHYDTLSDGQNHNSRIVAKLAKDAAGHWQMSSIGTSSRGGSLDEFVAATRRYL